jgi:regulation of enolase protein 1 (concanavalin A-like superfamily)
VTRTEPLNPILTITTETSATTVSEITIEGIASDPNGLTITTVTYELSGARTNSGIATGTTAWTFTEGLSAGDNRFDVTAINNWTPPLSGSDSLIVTYTPPVPVAFQDDEFNDSSIDPIWIQDLGVGGAVNESGTTLRLDSGEENITAGGTADFNWLYQDDIQGDFDVAIRVMDIDGSHSTGQILGLVAYIDNNNWAAIGVRYQSSTKQHHTCHRVSGSYHQTFGAAVGSYPQYWRVKRVDSTFSTYYSDDGSSWTPYDPVAGVLSDTNNVKIGLFANDQYTNTIEVYFDRVYNYVVAEDLVVVPDGDIISQWGTGGAGTGRWDRINSGVETPDDTNYIYGTDGDVQRFTMEAPSYSGASTRIRVYARGYDSFGYGLTAEIYDGAVKLGDSDVGYWTGSWSNKYGDWLTVAKTAAELADLEIKLTGQNSSGETYISELEIEIEK